MSSPMGNEIQVSAILTKQSVGVITFFIVFIILCSFCSYVCILSSSHKILLIVLIYSCTMNSYLSALSSYFKILFIVYALIVYEEYFLL